MPVPSCPEWNVADLLGHVGRLHRWVTAIIESEGNDPTDHWSNAEPPPSDVRLDWFDAGVDVVCDALLRVGRVDRGVVVDRRSHRGFLGPPAGERDRGAPLGRTGRIGAVEPIEHALAVDGIDEFFGLIPFWRGAAAVHGAGETIHLHSTDGDGEWLLRLADGAVIVTREHAKGDVAGRGPASDLLLFLYGRVEPSALEVFGDAAVLDRWHEQVRW